MEKLSFTNYSLENRDPNYRRQLIKELYTLYEQQKDKRKKENWKRYVEYLKERKQKDSPSSQNTFRKSGHFIVELSPARFAQRLWTLETRDIPWAISEIKSGRTFAWLFWKMKP